MGSILYLHTVPETGGDTLFASAAAAYDALSPRMKAYLEGLTALHSGERTYRRTNEKIGVDDSGKVFPKAVHPVVRTHPETGRSTLYVNVGFTRSIVGMDDEEARPLLRRLYGQSTIVDLQCRFRWRPGSVAFWDNRATQHVVSNDFLPARRVMERVTVKGDKPF
jgi:taurine dioxygenase